MIRIIGMFFLLVILVNDQMSYAQTLPAFVVSEARRAAQITGQTLSGAPSGSEAEPNEETGYNLWTLRWDATPPDDGYIEVMVDEQSGKAVRYRNHTNYLSLRAAFAVGQSVTVTEAQALSKLNALLRILFRRSKDTRLVSSRRSTPMCADAVWQKQVAVHSAPLSDRHSRHWQALPA
jgi:hypothetical protein